MTRKATKRKHYPADPMTMYRLQGRNSQFTQGEQAQVMIAIRKSFQAMIDRTAGREDFDHLATAVNVALVVGERIDTQVVELCKAGVAAMGRVLERHTKTGQWGLDGPAKVEIADVIEIYEQLMALMTGGQARQAMLEVMRRMKAGQVLAVAN